MMSILVPMAVRRTCAAAWSVLSFAGLSFARLSFARLSFAVLSFAVLPCAGCTLDAGSWFAVLTPTFEGRYATSIDRVTGDGWEKLNSNYQARLTRADVTVRDIQLQELGASASAAAAFNPANPPPGYSLCHNGHCHRDDGALVPYDEIAAEIAGSGGGAGVARAVVAFPIGETNMLAPARRPLTCTPNCRLGQAHIRLARATVTAVALEGLIRDAPSAAPRLLGELRWRWVSAFSASPDQPDADADIPAPSPVTLDCAADLPTDNAHPPAVTVALTLEARARLLDDIDWGALTAIEGAIDLAQPANAGGRALLRKNLGELELASKITRSD